MGQMSPMRQIHRQYFVPMFQKGEVHRRIRLRSRMGLHIRMLRPKQLLRAIDRRLLYHINKLTSPVPPLPRISFRVLIRQTGSLRLHNRGAREIL